MKIFCLKDFFIYGPLGYERLIVISLHDSDISLLSLCTLRIKQHKLLCALCFMVSFSLFIHPIIGFDCGITTKEMQSFYNFVLTLWV